MTGFTGFTGFSGSNRHDVERSKSGIQGYMTDSTKGSDPFTLAGKVAVVTGGYGVLGGTMAAGLSAAGARVAILGRRRELAEAKCDELRATGAEAMPLVADVLDEGSLRAARDELLHAW